MVVGLRWNYGGGGGDPECSLYFMICITYLSLSIMLYFVNQWAYAKELILTDYVFYIDKKHQVLRVLANRSMDCID